MVDIVDTSEEDRDIVAVEELARVFSHRFRLLTEKAVSLKKSYVNKLHGTRTLKLSVSLSDNTIELYEINTSSLTKLCKLSGHQKTISELVFSPEHENIVYSASLDGLIKMWDSRAGGSCVMEYKDEESESVRPLECMDVSCTGRVLCAGSQLVKDDAFIIFWDQRQTKPLGGYWNSHTDDITQIRFHSSKPETLATGSLDGLINIFNITEQTEDDALTYSLNAENSVEKLSWVNKETVSCITQSSDLQLWDAATGDQTRSFTREKIAYGIKRSKEDDCYAVDTYSMGLGSIALLAGSQADNGHCLRSVEIKDKKLSPCTNFIENKQVVRCCWQPQRWAEPNGEENCSDVTPYELSRILSDWALVKPATVISAPIYRNNLLVTAGESGIISVWESGNEDDASSEKLSLKMLNLTHKTHGKKRSKPY